MQPIKFYKPDPTAEAELRELSPLLHDLRPKAIEAAAESSPDTDYFAAMQTNVFANVFAKIEADEVQPKKMQPFKFWRNTWLKYAAAAAFVVGIAATALLLNTENAPVPLAKKASNYEQLLAEIDVADAEEYLLNNIDEIDLQLLTNSNENYDDLSAKIYDKAILEEAIEYELDDDF
jgi:hypothetical protein